MNDFIDEYKKCLKLREEIIVYNKKVKKKVRITHFLCALFFLCGAYLYLKPEYMQGIQGDALEDHIQAEYVHLVANGWTDIREIRSYLQEYRENKQNSYVILGNTNYVIQEIPDILLNSKWGVLAEPAIRAGAVVCVFGQRAYTSVVSLFILLKDSGKGVINIQHLGDVVANGIWVFSLHLLYWVILWFRRMCATFIYRNNNERMGIEDTAYADSLIRENRWVLVRNNENTRVVMFYDMVDIINHPLVKIEVPPVYAWIYAKIGIE
jgi:hypothetical protein